MMHRCAHPRALLGCGTGWWNQRTVSDAKEAYQAFIRDLKEHKNVSECCVLLPMTSHVPCVSTWPRGCQRESVWFVIYADTAAQPPLSHLDEALYAMTSRA